MNICHQLEIISLNSSILSVYSCFWLNLNKSIEGFIPAIVTILLPYSDAITRTQGHRTRGPGHYSRLFIKGIKPVVCVRLCHTFSAARAALWAADKGNNSIFTSQYLHRPLLALVRRVCWPHCTIVPAHRVQCHQPGLYCTVLYCTVLSLLTVSSVTSPARTLYSHSSSVT